MRLLIAACAYAAWVAFTDSAKRQAEHPDWIGYLVTQEVEYKELKERCAKAALAGESPEGVASIEVAIEALKLAEYLTPLLQKALK